jgi:hypothetical protein
MKKYLFPIALATPLALAACGQSEPTPEELFTNEAEQGFAPQETVEAPPELTEVAEGDTINITCYAERPCDSDLTLESVTMSDECVQHVDDYGMGAELYQGETYLQIEGIYELHSSAGGWSMLDDPQIINADGFTESVGMAINCHEQGEYQMWLDTLDVGQKAKHFGVWVVPEGATHALLGDAKIELPETDDKSEIILPDVWGDMPENTRASVPRDQVQESSYEEPAFDESEYEDSAPAYLTRSPEESQQQAEGQQWWSDCMATNTAEYCRATDPYQQ